VGPAHVRITKKDLKLFAASIDNLETIASWVAELNHDESTLKAVCSIIFDFGEIAHWYNLDDEKRRILKSLANVKKRVSRYEKGEQDVSKEKLSRSNIIEATIINLNNKYKSNERTHFID
jgi:hypothetical protein